MISTVITNCLVTVLFSFIFFPFYKRRYRQFPDKCDNILSIIIGYFIY